MILIMTAIKRQTIFVKRWASKDL